MSGYTLTLDLGALPRWARETVYDALLEHSAVVAIPWRDNTASVQGPDKQTVELACAAALQRVGKTIADVEIDLFA